MKRRLRVTDKKTSHTRVCDVFLSISTFEILHKQRISWAKKVGVILERDSRTNSKRKSRTDISTFTEGL